MSSSLESFLDTRPEPLPPPPGIEADLNAPNTNGTVYIIVAVIGIFLATVFVVVRVYTKAILTRSLGWDDFACVLTWVGAIIWTALNIKLAGLGMGMQVWNDNRTYRTGQDYIKTSLAINSIYFFTICLVKVTILMLYLRTFTESKRFRYIVYVVLSILLITHGATIPVVLAHIIPFHCQWSTYPTDDEWNSKCGDSEKYDVLSWLVFIAVLTIVLDIVILALPCPAVWRLHMAKRQRIAILLVLVAGVVVTIASILRLVYMIHRFYFDSHFTNYLYTDYQVNTISTVEIDIAIICACLPTLKAFLKRFLPKILGSSNTKPTAYSYKNSGGAQLPIGNQADRKWKSNSHEEQLTAPYVELEEDGKSNKSYAMESIQPQSA